MSFRLNTLDPRFAAAFELLLKAERAPEADMYKVVGDIIANVRKNGNEALVAYTRKFDRIGNITPETLRIPEAEIEKAVGQCDGELMSALKLAHERIVSYHERQLPANGDYTDKTGVRLGWRWLPVNAAGLYVPGGTAAYPSSVLMNAVPAIVAGVDRIAMVVPTPDGQLNPLVLAAAHVCGITEIYRLGGAQAVAALAYGTKTIKPVDIIVGPGNAYVAEAKKQVFGHVGIDMIAGPSEILVVADGKNNPAWIAADLLSQAEHDTSAQSILITDDDEFADAVAKAIKVLLTELPRAEIAGKSWEDNGAIITVGDLSEAVELINAIAPEHLELAIDDPDEMIKDVRNAGAIFAGRHTPEAVGDYVGGPNHVLPTGRSARFSSGLGVHNFLKRTSILGCDAQSIKEIGPAAVTLAKAEGLHAHARSVAERLK